MAEIAPAAKELKKVRKPIKAREIREPALVKRDLGKEEKQES